LAIPSTHVLFQDIPSYLIWTKDSFNAPSVVNSYYHWYFRLQDVSVAQIIYGPL